MSRILVDFHSRRRHADTDGVPLNRRIFYVVVIFAIALLVFARDERAIPQRAMPLAAAAAARSATQRRVDECLTELAESVHFMRSRRHILQPLRAQDAPRNVSNGRIDDRFVDEAVVDFSPQEARAAIGASGAWRSLGATIAHAQLGGRGLRVVFVGGSNTKGVYLEERSYCEMFMDWLNEALPNTSSPHTQLNIGLAGANAITNAARTANRLRAALQQHESGAAEHYDLFILETAVNDYYASLSPSTVRLCMEAMLEAIRRTQPRAAIVQLALDPFLFGVKNTRDTLSVRALLREQRLPRCVPIGDAGGSDGCGFEHTASSSAGGGGGSLSELMNEKKRGERASSSSSSSSSGGGGGERRKRELDNTVTDEDGVLTAQRSLDLCTSNPGAYKSLLVTHCHRIPSAQVPFVMVSHYEEHGTWPEAFAAQLPLQNYSRTILDTAFVERCVNQSEALLTIGFGPHPCLGGRLLSVAVMSRIIVRAYNAYLSYLFDDDVGDGSSSSSSSVGHSSTLWALRVEEMCTQAVATWPSLDDYFYSSATERMEVKSDMAFSFVEDPQRVPQIIREAPDACAMRWFMCTERAVWRELSLGEKPPPLSSLCVPLAVGDANTLARTEADIAEGKLRAHIHYNAPMWVNNDLWQNFTIEMAASRGCPIALNEGVDAENEAAAEANEDSSEKEEQSDNACVEFSFENIWWHAVQRDLQYDIFTEFLSAAEKPRLSLRTSLWHLRTHDARATPLVVDLWASYVNQTTPRTLIAHTVLDTHWDSPLSIPVRGDIGTLPRVRFVNTLYVQICGAQSHGHAQFDGLTFQFIEEKR